MLLLHNLPPAFVRYVMFVNGLIPYMFTVLSVMLYNVKSSRSRITVSEIVSPSLMFSNSPYEGLSYMNGFHDNRYVKSGPFQLSLGYLSQLTKRLRLTLFIAVNPEGAKSFSKNKIKQNRKKNYVLERSKHQDIYSKANVTNSFSRLQFNDFLVQICCHWLPSYHTVLELFAPLVYSYFKGIYILAQCLTPPRSAKIKTIQLVRATSSLVSTFCCFMEVHCKSTEYCASTKYKNVFFCNSVTKCAHACTRKKTILVVHNAVLQEQK